jgi:hypothetical protein
LSFTPDWLNTNHGVKTSINSKLKTQNLKLKTSNYERFPNSKNFRTIELQN